MIRSLIVNAIVLGLLLGGASLAWDGAADTLRWIGDFLTDKAADTRPIEVVEPAGTLGIRG